MSAFMSFGFKEKKVVKIAKALTKLLWKIGYRRKKSK